MDVEVEDILAVAPSGRPDDAAALRSLAEEQEWSRGPGGAGNKGPFGLWAEVTCAFIEGGYAAVEAFAADERSLSFARGVLEHQKTAESVNTLNRLALRFPDSESRSELAYTLNLVVSFKDAPALSAEARAASRAWLHPLLEGPTSSQALAACALRGVGDAESIEKISKLEPLPSPYARIEKKVIRAIRKRMHND